MKIDFRLNGSETQVDVPPMARLLDVLREDVRLTGTKEGCGEGECGACTVLVDGAAVNACLVPVAQIDGAEVTTIEGLAGAGHLIPLQQFFIDVGGTQCGICTPGMVLAAHELLEREPDPNRQEIREAVAGNLCRCTGYQQIVDAIEETARAKRERQS